MKWHFTVVVLLACAATAAAADRVKRQGKETVFGDIVSMNSSEVVVKDRAARTKIPVGEIRGIVFDGEPAELSTARADVAQGRFEDAQRALAKLGTSRIDRGMVAADVDFYRALVAAELALRGKGEIREAGSEMAKFVARHRDNYHWFEANRLVGDLLMANRQYTTAAGYYDKLAKAPWFEAQLQGVVGRGRAELAEGKLQQAESAFDEAIAMKPRSFVKVGPEVARYKRLAEIGKARCLADSGKATEAINQLRRIIDESEPEDKSLADAYNALGTALRKAGKPYDALLAFLHVDILYFAEPEAHAEALANLSQLWHEVNKTNRAIQAQETLQSRYPNSRWSSQ